MEVCLCRLRTCSPFDAAAAPGVCPFAVDDSLPAAPEFSSSLPAAEPFLYSNASSSSAMRNANNCCTAILLEMGERGRSVTE